MHVKTYRAKTMQDALALVRRDLGPTASVLQTRQVRCGGLFKWFSAARQYEVVASASLMVPSRLPARVRGSDGTAAGAAAARDSERRRIAMGRLTPASQGGVDLASQINQLQLKVDLLCRQGNHGTKADMPAELFALFTELLDGDVCDEVARDLVEVVRREASDDELRNLAALRARVTAVIESRIPVAPPIRCVPGERRLVALVGPTGVGKTTTIAKLAANFRLRQKRRVGLITVDTYRIAAVEQLRTYADIIDLPMEIVATPREMHQAVARMRDLDLVLMDTAGRSPRDEVKIQELKSMLAEAKPDEVHLVLSSVASAATLARTAEQFANVGTSALILTKLDEALSLGNLMPLVQASRLPLSYLTNGQNVPDDIAPADAVGLARMVMGGSLAASS
jgi:flagellar biosynthesis protein FlhF